MTTIGLSYSLVKISTKCAPALLDKVVIKFRREGKEVAVIGLNDASATLVDRFAIHDKRQEGEPLLAEH